MPTRIEGAGTDARRPGAVVETPAGADADPPCMVRQAAATIQAPATAATQAALGVIHDALAGQEPCGASL